MPKILSKVIVALLLLSLLGLGPGCSKKKSSDITEPAAAPDSVLATKPVTSEQLTFFKSTIDSVGRLMLGLTQSTMKTLPGGDTAEGKKIIATLQALHSGANAPCQTKGSLKDFVPLNPSPAVNVNLVAKKGGPPVMKPPKEDKRDKDKIKSIRTFQYELAQECPVGFFWQDLKLTNQDKSKTEVRILGRNIDISRAAEVAEKNGIKKIQALDPRANHGALINGASNQESHEVIRYAVTFFDDSKAILALANHFEKRIDPNNGKVFVKKISAIRLTVKNQFAIESLVESDDGKIFTHKLNGQESDGVELFFNNFEMLQSLTSVL